MKLFVFFLVSYLMLAGVLSAGGQSLEIKRMRVEKQLQEVTNKISIQRGYVCH